MSLSTELNRPTTALLEDSEIPKQFEYCGRPVLVISLMQNHYSRALVLRINSASAPVWLSNNEVRDAIAKATGSAT